MHPSIYILYNRVFKYLEEKKLLRCSTIELKTLSLPEKVADVIRVHSLVDGELVCATVWKKGFVLCSPDGTIFRGYDDAYLYIINILESRNA